jgi:hypothetical protein
MTKEEKREYDKKYRQIHKEERRLKNKEFCQTHKEEKKIYDKEYYQNHKKERRVYYKKYNNNKFKTDTNFKLAYYLRCRLRHALKGNYKTGSAVQDLGCPIPEFKRYLESKFQEGMTWENWSKTGWHIDHIIPLDNFNLQNREEFLKACHYTNLQPLWAEENIRKYNKIINNSEEMILKEGKQKCQCTTIERITM